MLPPCGYSSPRPIEIPWAIYSTKDVTCDELSTCLRYVPGEEV